MRTRVPTASAALLLLAGFYLSGLDGVAARQTATTKSTKPAPQNSLDQVLAPIALYPDQLLAQMLLCASTPAKVTELHKWLTENNALKGTELQDAATVAGFDPSFVALALFPDVVRYMAERIDWTTQLGKAFAANKTAVFDSIQRLRKQAHESGALKTTPQQEVETKTTSAGQQVIVIEPANPQVIYVPQYNPTVVYTAPTTTTVVVKEDNDSDAAVAGLIGFTAGIALGAAMDNDYYYGPYGWHGGVYMYNDAWDDWYDHREDAREDWIDHREELVEERGDYARDTQQQRTERQQNRTETRSDTQTQRTERTQARQENRPAGSTSTYQSKGNSGGTTQAARSGTSSDAFSGYSSGKSERAASSRGQASRSASGSRGGGARAGGGGRGGGGGRRR